MQTSPFTEEHRQLRATIRRVVDEELAPHADRWEAEGWLDDGVFRRLGELGFLGLRVPVEHGGQGGDYWSSVVLAEELARAGSGSLAMAIAAQTDMATPPILEFGTAAQRRDYLEPALAGEKVAAIGISEPEAGSDVRGVRTRARRDGDGWVLDGAKTDITNGVRADFVTMVVRTADASTEDPWGGLSLFLVDTDLPGFGVASRLDKVGMRACDTARLQLDGVRVGPDALLGELHQGFRQIMWQLEAERLIAAVGSVASAQVLFERALAYTREREAFGRRLADFQVTQHKLAELATRIAAVRALVYETCDAWNRGADPTERIAMSKLAAAQLGFDVADEVLQLHGGYGYAEEFGVARAWRDARLHRIAGGSDEVQREIISRHLDTRSRAGKPPTEMPATATASALPLFTPEHEALRASARAFVAAELAPHVESWERAGDFPREVFRKVGEAGFLGLGFGPEVGGSGPDVRAQAVWVEELARCLSGGLAADLGATTDLAGTYLRNAGTDEQRRRFLPGLIAGERIGALAITEPGAGSDVAGIRTRARRDGDGWVLDGAKVFITNGPWADHLVVAAKVAAADGAPGDDPHQQLTLFVVDGQTPGLSRRRLQMLGWATSHTGELTFEGVRIDDQRRLGAIGSGFGHITTAFAWERLVLALGAVAAAERTLELAIAYGREREAFGRPVGTVQMWRHRFADLATRIAGARALTYQGLRLLAAREQGAAVDQTEVVRTAAMAKLVTQRLAFEVADEGVQIHGGAGYLMESPIQRAWRDARLGPIGGGTDEIMRQLIARTL
ncbi:MAG: acyl-CoA dehydrogenase family protein [Nitriliruptoraceae bacterium]